MIGLLEIVGRIRLFEIKSGNILCCKETQSGWTDGIDFIINKDVENITTELEHTSLRIYK